MYLVVDSAILGGMSFLKKWLDLNGKEQSAPVAVYPDVNDLVTLWDARSKTRVEQMSSPNVTEGQLVRMLARLNVRDPQIFVGGSGWQPPEDRQVMIAVCSNPLLPVPVMENIIARGHISECTGLASNPACTAELLVRLREMKFSAVQLAALDNPNLPLSAFNPCKGDSIKVRVHVASHKRTPGSVLKTMGDAENRVNVIENIISNLNTPLETVMRLGKDDPQLQLIVAANPNVPVSDAAGIVQAWLEQEISLGAGPGWMKGEPREALMAVRVPVLVELIKYKFPEVNENMPREWLLDLWNSVER